METTFFFKMASRRLPDYGKGYRNANSDAILIISVSIPMFSGPGKPILQLKFGFKYILCSFNFNTRLFSQNIFVFFTVFVLLRNKATILDACQFLSGLATLSKFCMHICLCFRYMCYEFQCFIYSIFFINEHLCEPPSLFEISFNDTLRSYSLAHF